MTYSPTTQFHLTDLLQSVYSRLGQLRPFVATGGSDTTAAYTGFGDDFEDDNGDGQGAFWNGTLFVQRDADGSYAAPEGQFQRVLSYVQEGYIITVGAAFTAAIVAGDTCALASPLFQLGEVTYQCNDALRSLGDLPLIDNSITTVANQTEYTLPLVCKRTPPFKVEIQGITTDANDNQWVEFRDWYVTPVTPGSTGLFVTRRQFPAGYTINLWYYGRHPTLTVYDSVVSEYIHPELAIAACLSKTLEWFNGRAGGGSDFWIDKENVANIKLRKAETEFPIWRPAYKPHILTWNQDGTEDDFTFPEPV